MDITGKVGFIGGGQMAAALIQGIVSAGLVAADKILVAEPVAARREVLNQQYGVRTTDSNAEVVDQCETVILAVKPQVMKQVLPDLATAASPRLCISIAAGVSLETLEAGTAGSSCRFIRVMPNTPALIGQGASALCGGAGVSAGDLERAQAMFNAVGISIVVEEQYLDAVTGLSGSGPAYVFTFLEGLIDGGVAAGLPRPVAQQLAEQTVLGSVRLVRQQQKHPAELTAMVTSPGGTTIAALHGLEKAGFRGIVMDAVITASQRSRELGG